MNSMCLFMENIFTGTKYIQNVVENLEEAFQTKTKRGVGVSLAGASFSQDRIHQNFPLTDINRDPNTKGIGNKCVLNHHENCFPG